MESVGLSPGTSMSSERASSMLRVVQTKPTTRGRTATEKRDAMLEGNSPMTGGKQ